MEELLKQTSTHCKRIVLYGPESTGKTTLSRQLAQHFKTQWVPEFARAYLQEKWNDSSTICEPQDMLPIALGQMELENKIATQVTDLLICDTNLLVTKVYSESYYNGWCEPLIAQYGVKNHYDLYLLTYIDTPWEEDDLRDRPDKREEMFSYFKAELDTHHKNYILLKGSEKERLDYAIKEINKLLL